jgi:tetratricopeptide (TPR) repeat protein
MRTRLAGAVLGGVLGLPPVVLGGQAPPEARATESELSSLEARVRAAPDDLRPANEYRLAVIRTGAYERALGFFEELVRAHPASANAHLSYALAIVDKIPAAGSVTQVVLANSALARVARAVELQPSWVGYYTRGVSYLYWPKVFGRAHLAAEDLERALAIQKTEPPKPYHARTYVSLGDAYWKVDDLAKARAVWQQGLEAFPGHPALSARLSREGDALDALILDALDYSRRADTDLRPLWGTP